MAIQPRFQKTVKWLAAHKFVVQRAEWHVGATSDHMTGPRIVIQVLHAESLVDETFRLYRELQEAGVALRSLAPDRGDRASMTAVYLPAPDRAVIYIMDLDDASFDRNPRSRSGALN